MRYITSKIYTLAGFVLLGFSLAHKANATIISSQFASDVRGATGLGNSTPVDTAITAISVFLSLLGIIALIIVIYAGFRWMTAAGNEEQIKEAKGMLRAAVIGIAIILFSYTIAQFIFSNLEAATGQTAVGA